MSKTTYAEKLLLEGVELINEIMPLRDIPEELRVSLAKWRMAVEAVTSDSESK